MTDELIAKLEAAEGPCRELDAEIMAVFYVRDERHIGVREGWEDEDFDNCLPVKSEVWVDPATNKWVSTHAHHYTANTDDALSLVPPDCWQEIKGPRKYLNIPTPVPNVWSAYIAKWNHEGDVMGWGATPALAIVIAALKARVR